MRFHREGVLVEWLEGGLYVEHDGVGLLVDAPAGLVDRAGARLGRVQALALTSGRIRAVGGLVPLLVEMARVRTTDVPLSIRFPLGEERGAMLAETWVRGWPDLYPLTLDAELPGATFEVGAMSVRTLAIRAGEPRWRDGTVHGLEAVAVRIETPGPSVAWVPGAAPSQAVARACANVDLAVVEVGVVPFPPTPHPWRLTVDDAVRLGRGAGALWIVGDDGRMGVGEAH